jgi:hypothetical protein
MGYGNGRTFNLNFSAPRDARIAFQGAMVSNATFNSDL